MYIWDDKAISHKCVKQILKLLKIENVSFEAERDNTINGYCIRCDGDKLSISYKKTCDFYRALLYIAQNGAAETTQNRKYEQLGYMVDVARNAVPKIETLKRLVTYLACLGYNRLYIYLEDVFEVDNEPFFGYLRGRYTEAELKELDDYCAEFDIELVPCIQTLAHLNAIFKWPEYEKCCDTGDILLVGDSRTETLITNMFKTISRVFRSKTLHVGMDEAHLVGRGKYLDKNGYKTGYEVMAEHIKKVVDIAKPFGFNLMVWSDMYFRLAFGGGYYSADSGLPEEISAQIPKNVTLTYWDYFSRQENTLMHMMNEHIKTGNNVSFAGGAWKWTGWNPSTKFSLMTSKVALDVCEKSNVKDIMLTAWSDDGAEASLFTTLPIIVYFAERCYGKEVGEKQIDGVLKTIFGLTLEDFLVADMPLISKEEFEEDYYLGKLPKILVYNDPMSGVFDGIIQKYDMQMPIKKYMSAFQTIKKRAPEEFKYIFINLENLCKVLELKASLGVDIRKAYKAKDREQLQTIAKKRIPALIRRIRHFERGFYQQWMLENKDNGYQTHDLRLGGLCKRLQTVKGLLCDYLDGKIEEIYELRNDLQSVDGDDALGMLLWKDWKYMHSVYVV